MMTTIRPILLCISSTLLLGSCATVQVYDTTAPSLSETTNTWEYENELTKINYMFWASRGVLSLSIYNKSDQPIYVDWKNSSFIQNDDKFNYWTDESFTSYGTYYKGYYYSGPLLKAGTVSTVIKAEQTSGRTTKPERITFIPPKSYYYNSSFYLLSNEYFKINKKDAVKKIIDGKKAYRRFTYYELIFDKTNSPLRFRNYLALSTSENAQIFIFIDNQFYVSSIKQMKRSVFRGRTTNFLKDEPTTYEYPFTRGTSFYYELPSSIAYD